MSNVFFDIDIEGSAAGRITFQLYDSNVPKTAQNFRELCTMEHSIGYDQSRFHRVIPGFMLQGGDFTHNNGTGGRSIYGECFDDEKAGLELKHDQPGLLSMANMGPNTNGSQFFITVAPCPWLDGQHVVFGEVVDGMDIVKRIEECGSQSGEPSKTVVISACGEC